MFSIIWFQYEVGLKAADKIKERYGTQYTVGNIVDVICKYTKVFLFMSYVSTYSL